MAHSLGEYEQIVLLARARLGDDAYGIAIRDKVAARTHRDIAVGTIYKTLWRRDHEGLVVSRIGDPTSLGPRCALTARTRV